MRPTPAQRRALLAAIDNHGKVRHRVGPSASRLRASLLRNSWIEDDGYVTLAGRIAVGRAPVTDRVAAPTNPTRKD